MSKIPVVICSDCGGRSSWMSEAAIRKGSATREPGETLCASCNSSRVVLLRQVDALPTKLDQIKAMRM